MASLPPDPASALPGEIVPAVTKATGQIVAAALTDEAKAVLAGAQDLAGKAAAPATLRAYKADWTHYAAWCANMVFCWCPQSHRRSGPMSAAWPRAMHRSLSTGGCRRLARCTGLTICRGTRRTATSRDRCSRRLNSPGIVADVSGQSYQ
jgi:hypothetical protein